MATTVTSGSASSATRLRPAPGTFVTWRGLGMAMSLVFAVLYLMSEVGSLMAVNLYGSMAAELDLSPATVNWALLATTIAGAATVALGARAGDVFGHRRILMISLALVAVGFVISAIAPNFVVLVIGRALVGFISLKPALVMAIVQDRLDPENRHKAIAMITAGLALAVAVSFAIGGVLLEIGASWRAAFWAAGALIALCLVFVAFFVPESDARSRSTGRRSFDLGGAVLLGLALSGICIALNQSTTWGLSSGLFVGFLGAGMILAVAWVLWELRAPEPLVDLRLAISRRLWPIYATWAVIGLVAFFLYTMVVSYGVTSPDVAGYGFGLTPLLAGFILLPVTIGGLITSQLAPRMIRWWGPRATLVIGAVGFLIGFVILWQLHTEIWHYLVGITFFGLSVTTTITVSLAVLVGEAPAGKSASTVGLYIVLATVAVSVGVALYGFSMGSATLADGVTPAPAAFELGYFITVLVAAAGVVVSLFLPRDSKAAEGAGH